MKRRYVAALCAVSVLLCAGCTGEETYTADDLKEAYEEGYQDGYEDSAQDHYSEDEMGAAFASGYDTGWNDKSIGVEYGENMIIAYVK